MTKKSETPEANNRQCSSWEDITKFIDEFPAPEVSTDCIGGDIDRKEWAFRGLKSSCYELEPTIERKATSRNMDWATLEALVSREFQTRARMHLGAPLIPADEFTWLAQMQHYAAPTRLLDFTYSPFVALYFAIRNGGHEKPDRTHVRLYAVDTVAVNCRFSEVAREAREAARKKTKKKKEKLELVPGRLDDFAYTNLDSIIAETQGLHKRVAGALAATGTYRDELNRRGCICAASPPIFNPRLASQQGLFLFNCALGRSFKESLEAMMAERREWSKAINIPVSLIPDIERRLFQMNVHEQSLFPDMEGLAGLIHQKLRLHWI